MDIKLELLKGYVYLKNIILISEDNMIFRDIIIYKIADVKTDEYKGCIGEQCSEAERPVGSAP